MSRHVEYLLADEDGTWRTKILPVPAERDPADYALTDLSVQTQYRRIVYWGVYNSEVDPADLADLGAEDDPEGEP